MKWREQVNNNTLSRIQASLQMRRTVLTDWLRSTPAQKKQMRLGPADERAVELHVETVETAIQKAKDETLGICTVCHDYVDTGLLEMDYTTSVCLAHFSAEEVSRLEAELELAQSVQKALLPHQAPAIPGVQVAAFSRPAQILGGDFIDFPQFRDGAHGLLIGDVAGKGVSAGLLMASVQASARTLALDADSPAQVLQRVNDMFCHNVHMTTFVTLFLAHLDPDLRTLTYCNAGHNPPLLFRGQPASGEITWLNPTNPAIGLVEDSQFKARTISLLPGDLLLLYTDGVTEAENAQGEEFGPERLAEFLTPGQSARAIVLGLQQKLQEFTASGPLADDTTIVACRIAE
jgi:sigma-B regulation protein RsbU (phosphoserine phosphatase)